MTRTAPLTEHVSEISPNSTTLTYTLRSLQYDEAIGPEFPNGEPDVAQGFSSWAEYRNRRQARATQRGIYKPLDTPARFRLTESHSFGRMSAKRLMEIIE